MSSSGIGVKRRSILRTLVPLSVYPGLAFGQHRSRSTFAPKSPPVFTGFGLNGGPDQDRYKLTAAFVRRRERLELASPQAFDFVRPLLVERLSARGDLVQFKSKIEFGEDLLVGFAHDFEAAVGARIEQDGKTVNTLVVFMAGTGLILGFDRGSGWRIVTSFPFMLRLERPGGDLTGC